MNDTNSTRRLPGTKTLLAVAAVALLAIAFLQGVYTSKTSTNTLVTNILQKERSEARKVQTIVQGVLAAASTNEQIMAILALTQLQAAGSIIESAIKDSDSCRGAADCLFALGYVKMSIAMNGLPKTDAEDKALATAYQTAYAKFAAATAKEGLGF